MSEAVDATVTPEPPAWTKIWDSAVARFAAVAAYLVALVYVSGALVIWTRLHWRNVHASAVIGQIPKPYLLTIGFEEVFLPTVVILGVAWLWFPKFAFKRKWTTWSTEERGGLNSRKELGQRLALAVVLSALVAIAAAALYWSYKRNTATSPPKQGLSIFAVLTVLFFLALQVRDTVQEIDWAKGGESAHRFYGAIATLPIVMLGSGAIGTALPFPTVNVCEKGVTIPGNFIAEDGSSAYLLQTYVDPDTKAVSAGLVLVPLSAIEATFVGNGACTHGLG